MLFGQKKKKAEQKPRYQYNWNSQITEYGRSPLKENIKITYTHIHNY
jgi:hypothetical protein